MYNYFYFLDYKLIKTVHSLINTYFKSSPFPFQKYLCAINYMVRDRGFSWLMGQTNKYVIKLYIEQDAYFIVLV